MDDNDQHFSPSEEVGDVASTADEPTVVQQAETPARTGWRGRLRDRRVGLAASGVGLVLVAGLAGFGIGHATAGDGDHDRVRFGPGHHGEMRGEGPGRMRGDGPGRMRGEGPREQAPEAPSR